MRATRITVAAFAAALLLTACDDGGGDGGSGSGASKAAGGGCTLDAVGVRVDASPAPAAGDSGNVTVTITNRGSQCTLNGYPGVDLAAGSTSAKVPVDKASKAAKLTLAKEATASFTISYVRGEAGGTKSLAVKTGRFSLLGATADHSFAWSYGEVALKGDAGTPYASVTAFTQAGD
ncbi:DUF4232 domain-containing protein [Streptomyces pseudovenezuelae]|uniref:DUF4232 domain-containing protein n=1 Tax=Streptomyces pseudovenezuelae TaxID=67350 RepID=A0ABT6LE79_9ACTN|nr:DUF4232 domain-containing protein [Streptomyces pseudovenezuelae]MDH6214614.1 hypothetical protein [Streptomyces pseudovenezuelae]